MPVYDAVVGRHRFVVGVALSCYESSHLPWQSILMLYAPSFHLPGQFSEAFQVEWNWGREMSIDKTNKCIQLNCNVAIRDSRDKLEKC